MNKKYAVKLIVRGKVQGVYYRKSTLNKALELGLHGWVENKSDGTVHILAQGSTEALTSLVTWCHSGPSQAVVERVDQKVVLPVEASNFKIKR